MSDYDDDDDRWSDYTSEEELCSLCMGTEPSSFHICEGCYISIKNHTKDPDKALTNVMQEWRGKRHTFKQSYKMSITSECFIIAALESIIPPCTRSLSLTNISINTSLNLNL